MNVYLEEKNMPKSCVHCPFRDYEDACILQDEDANSTANNLDDLKRGCPLIAFRAAQQEAEKNDFGRSTKTCPKCGAIAEDNAYYGRTTCTRCGWESEQRGHSKPLTLDELLEMDGEPVWVEFQDGSGGCWGLVHLAVFNHIVFKTGLYCSIGKPYYGKIWLAYRCEPKEKGE